MIKTPSYLKRSPRKRGDL
ncbi:hypothetical protein NR488_004614 [Salmonella enterica]|nr:hypothetical protein [Salmonella enterica]